MSALDVIPKRSRGSSAFTVTALLGAVVYVLFARHAGFDKVSTQLSNFTWSAAAAALALAAFNYALRFLKWELYLRRLDVRIPFWDSLRIFLSGFALTVTPGKIGEVLKSYLLRETHGIPMARTAPTVVADRVTDLIALIALSLVGFGALGGGERLLFVAAGLIVGFVLVASWRPFALAILNLLTKLPGLRRAAPTLTTLYESTAVLIRPMPLITATTLSLVAWTAECVAFWIVLKGFGATAASLKLCTFIYAAMTVAGALSFLPGGLGVQEAGMVALLVKGTTGIEEATAFAATFVTRVCTLWFAVAIGLVALSLVRRGTKVDVAALAELRAQKSEAS